MTRLSCACGKFHLEVEDEPFITAECHCKSCREGSERLSKLPLARPMTGENGGTPYVLYRKDRVRFTKLLKELVENHSRLPRRLLYGSDWMLNNLQAEHYPEACRIAEMVIPRYDVQGFEQLVKHTLEAYPFQELSD